jgi:hypothetical protein
MITACVLRNSSFPRRRESRSTGTRRIENSPRKRWIPACAGMTLLEAGCSRRDTQSDFFDELSLPFEPESDLGAESLDGALSASADFL